MIERTASTWLSECFGVDVDFDTADAMETLDRFELWADRTQRVPVDPAEALRRLRAHWAQARSLAYHLERWDRLAVRPARVGLASR